jgi:uncharacterized membrane protein YkoI
MNKGSFIPAAGALIVAVGMYLAPAGTSRAESPDNEKPAAQGSIRIEGKVNKADRPALAKISFSEALKDALAAAPGDVVVGELEVEDGNLQYSFEIVGSDKKVTEVEIDAGNGKVLGMDKDND